jgi:hypothetical protein
MKNPTRMYVGKKEKETKEDILSLAEHAPMPAAANTGSGSNSIFSSALTNGCAGSRARSMP